ncbi:MAG: hypothetical protein PHH01_00975 [Patescibacteria group bacterium]|nr:hypothetical protein [Patescibacteria group bacterium]
MTWKVISAVLAYALSLAGFALIHTPKPSIWFLAGLTSYLLYFLVKQFNPADIPASRQLLWRGKSVVGWTILAGVSCSTCLLLPLLIFTTQFGAIKDWVDALPLLYSLTANLIISLVSFYSVIGFPVFTLGALVMILLPIKILETPGKVTIDHDSLWRETRTVGKTFSEQSKECRWIALYGNPVGFLYWVIRALRRFRLQRVLGVGVSA